MTSNVLLLYLVFSLPAPSQANSSQNSNVDNFLRNLLNIPTHRRLWYQFTAVLKWSKNSSLSNPAGDFFDILWPSQNLWFLLSHVPSKYNTAKWPLKSNADFEDEKSLSVLA